MQLGTYTPTDRQRQRDAV